MATIFDETMSSMRPEIQNLLRNTGIKSERIRNELSKKDFESVFTQQVEDDLKLNIGEKIELKMFFNMGNGTDDQNTNFPKQDAPKFFEKETKKKDETLTDKSFRPRLESKGFGMGAERIRLQQQQIMEDISKKREEALKGTFDFYDGSRYIGEMRDGLPFGKGVCHYVNGNKFVGKVTQCLNNGMGLNNAKINGSGVLYYANRNKFVGDIKEDMASGTGVLHFSNSSTYEGEVSNDKANGKGVLYLMTGQSFDGEWRDDKFFGSDTIGGSPATNGKACTIF